MSASGEGRSASSRALRTEHSADSVTLLSSQFLLARSRKYLLLNVSVLMPSVLLARRGATCLANCFLRGTPMVMALFAWSPARNCSSASGWGALCSRNASPQRSEQLACQQLLCTHSPEVLGQLQHRCRGRCRRGGLGLAVRLAQVNWLIALALARHLWPGGVCATVYRMFQAVDFRKSLGQLLARGRPPRALLTRKAYGAAAGDVF